MNTNRSHIITALALAVSDAKSEDQVAGVALALHRIADEIERDDWGFDRPAFVAEVERLGQGEKDRRKAMASLGQMLKAKESEV